MRFQKEGFIMRILAVGLFLLLTTGNAQSTEIAGISIPETITHQDGTVLHLNGAGIRSKFIVKVYIAQLYLAQKSSDSATLLAADGHRRVVMHFLYDKVDKESLVDAFNDGFNGNGTETQLTDLADKIERFNNAFETVRKGERIVLDYAPGTGTTVFIRDEEKARIEGKPFNDLLLSIWLGNKPVTKGLKDKLLGK